MLHRVILTTRCFCIVDDPAGTAKEWLFINTKLAAHTPYLPLIASSPANLIFACYVYRLYG